MTICAIDQLVVDGALADLSTSIALRIRAALRRSGPSELYAVRVDSSIADDILPCGQLDNSRERVLLYHAGSVEPKATRAILASSSRLVLMWSGADTGKASADWIRYEMELLRPRVFATVAGSVAGVAALESLGFPGVRLLPMCPTTNDDVLPIAPTWTEGLGTRLRGRRFALAFESGGATQRSQMVVEAVSLVQRVIGMEVGLVVVGGDVAGPHAAAVRELARQRKLRSTWFPAGTDRAALHELLRSASLVVLTAQAAASPLAFQAIAAGTPVISERARPLEEVAPDGVIMLPPGAGPMMLAELINLVVGDDTVRAELVARGQRFTDSALRLDSTDRLVQLLEGLAG